MKLNDLAEHPQARKLRTRVGRGIGSGLGKTSGRGQKGQGSRSGVAIKGFEGGQMSLLRRLPKRGFNNIHALDYVELNLGRLQDAIDTKQLDAKDITGEKLVAAGVLRRLRDGVRLLAKGSITSAVTITVAGASKSAIAAVEKAGGKVEVAAPKAAPVEA
ncbi:50S ribosomal protein L15 [Govanella unica]|uniref:Large ribosomal subunit protein uL15 n=1 Tax=Govanella unica TaxID=2975056 RepID=A0A9X3TWW1_9PROT|nr:50S ribosomal protein L15 [Govania unica]MDA5193074.1 50S ribosomal protein L15 [Govania unica]